MFEEKQVSQVSVFLFKYISLTNLRESYSDISSLYKSRLSQTILYLERTLINNIISDITYMISTDAFIYFDQDVENERKMPEFGDYLHDWMTGIVL